MNDNQIEQQIQAAGLTAPRITPERIESLMQRVTYTFDVRPNNTNATFCHAFLDGRFFLASGMSACVSAENFNEKIGREIAQGNAQRDARNKLWELEGYALYKTLNEGA